jgi:uncharacterized protein YodC (DUF2158 family)/nucleoside 2-deoxyribosyltransferase
MANMAIENGDLVRLKSGGPVMSVEHVDSQYNLIDCVWHDGKRKNRDTFGLNVLEKASDPALAKPACSSSSAAVVAQSCPPEIQDSLNKFKVDHPDERKTAFIMMRFSETASHNEIVRVIKAETKAQSITAVRADDKQYHSDLFPNIKTYMHGCGFGIAVFERIETEDTNPNVALEVGYLCALNKPVLLLKDQTLRTLQTDLAGRIYRPFDTSTPEKTLPAVIKKWLEDNGFA